MSKIDEEECEVTGKILTENDLKVVKDITKRRIGIYGLFCRPTKKWYVGQSVDIIRRLSIDYRLIKCKNQPKLYFALKRYGYDNFTKVIIEECENDKRTLDSLEIKWVNHYNACDNGYNCTNGGNQHRSIGLAIKDTINRPKRKLSAETKEKIRNSLKKYHTSVGRRPHSKKHRCRIGESLRMNKIRKRWLEST